MKTQLSTAFSAIFMVTFFIILSLHSNAEQKYKYGHREAEKSTEKSESSPKAVEELNSKTPGKKPESVSAKQIIVDLSEQELTFRVGDEVQVYRISSGKLTTPTRVGEYKVKSKHRSYLLKEVLRDHGIKRYMPYWLMIEDSLGLGIHGVENDWGLLYPASGGCIRLNIKDAEKLFPQVDIGTPVSIIGSAQEYVDKNHPFPWQGSGLEGLIVPWKSDGTVDGGYGFNKSLTPENISKELRDKLQLLWGEKILGVYNPTPRMIAKDPRWKNGEFINFPNIPEMGSPGLQSFDDCLKRYFTIREFEALVGLPIKRNK